MDILQRGEKKEALEYLGKNPRAEVCGFPLCALFLTQFHASLTINEFSNLFDVGCPVSPLQVLYLYNPLLVRWLLKRGKLDIDEVIFDFCKTKPEPGKSRSYIETLRVLLTENNGRLQLFSKDGLQVREILERNNFTRVLLRDLELESIPEVLIPYEEMVSGI